MATDPNTNQPIFHGATRAGLRNVGSYQVAGQPFITGSSMWTGRQMLVSFPYVTKKITVIASGSQGPGGLRVHFAATGSGRIVEGNHYIVLNSHEDSVELDVKCKEVYISSPSGSGGYMLYASLTNIPTSSMYTLTGAGITD